MKNVILLLVAFVPFLCNAQISSHPQTYIAGTIKLSDNRDRGTGVWSSSNTGIATVNSTSGLVTGVSSGTVQIRFTLGGVKDSSSLYVAASDSSGYYIENENGYSNTGVLEQRDCDGVTILNVWAGGISPTISGTLGGSGLGGVGVFYQTYVSYSVINSLLSLTFVGVQDGNGHNLTLGIPYSKIKYIAGNSIPAQNDGVTLIGLIRKYGF